MGVSICNNCRIQFYKPDVEEMDHDERYQNDADFFCASSTEDWEKFNDLLGQFVSTTISPIRYQITTLIEDLSQDMKNKRKLCNVREPSASLAASISALVPRHHLTPLQAGHCVNGWAVAICHFNTNLKISFTTCCRTHTMCGLL
jgi:hypothetical protein